MIRLYLASCFYFKDDYIWLHIRGVGEWTNRLHDYFSSEHKRLHDGEVPAMITGGSANGPNKELINAVEMFNEHVNTSDNSNGPDTLTESKISPLVLHSNGKMTADSLRMIQR